MALTVSQTSNILTYRLEHIICMTRCLTRRGNDVKAKTLLFQFYQWWINICQLLKQMWLLLLLEAHWLDILTQIWQLSILSAIHHVSNSADCLATNIQTNSYSTYTLQFSNAAHMLTAIHQFCNSANSQLFIKSLNRKFNNSAFINSATKY